MFKKLLPSAICLLSLTSCATIVHGTRQNVSISSTPSNAEVWLDRSYVGTTPLIIAMTRNDSHFVSIELEGYERYEIVLSREISGWAFGNIFIGGIGLAVDAISGGLYKLTPDQVQAHLRTGGTLCTKSNDSLITVVMKPDPSWTKIGQLRAL